MVITPFLLLSSNIYIIITNWIYTMLIKFENQDSKKITEINGKDIENVWVLIVIFRLHSTFSFFKTDVLKQFWDVEYNERMIKYFLLYCDFCWLFHKRPVAYSLSCCEIICNILYQFEIVFVFTVTKYRLGISFTRNLLLFSSVFDYRSSP